MSAAFAIAPRPAASPASPAPSERRPAILVHLTSAAPGIPADARLHAPCRWMQFASATPRQALARILERLELHPADAALTETRSGEVEITDWTAPNAPRAFIVEGLTWRDAIPALQSLRADARQ